MTDTNLAVRDGGGATQNLRVQENGDGSLTSYLVEDTTQRAALIAALDQLATHADAEAAISVLDAMQGHLETLAGAQAALATAANQAAMEALLTAIEGYLATLASEDAGLATSALQTIANTDLAAIVTALAHGQATRAASVPVTMASDPDTRATGVITVPDINTAASAGQSGSSLQTGAATANSFVALAVNGQSSLTLTVEGTPAFTGQLEVDASYDNGVSWVARAGSLIGATANVNPIAITAAGVFQYDIADATNVRVRATALTAGSVAVALAASSVAGIVKILNAMGVMDRASGASLTVKPASTKPARTDTAVVVAPIAGGTGTDWSQGAPNIPVVGSAFTTGPYAGYVRIALIPANPGRANVEIHNPTGALLAVVRDDGTAANGAAPTNASVFPLGPGPGGAGSRGDVWQSTTFSGRLQVYAPAPLAGTAFETAFED